MSEGIEHDSPEKVPESIKRDSRENLVHFVRLADESERYEDMAQTMKKLIEMDTKLNGTERNLLYVAYRKVANAKRFAWRVISDFLKEAEGITEGVKQMSKNLLAKLEQEMDEKCNEIMILLDNLLENVTDDHEAEVFYLKVKGDHLRYLAETKTENDDIAQKANEAYQKALDIAKDKIHPFHPTRLSVALNFSIFKFEIQNLPRDASELAKQTYEEAAVNLKQERNESNLEAFSLMDLLAENQAYWMELIQ